MTSQSVEVNVKEAAHEDAGRGIARISIEIMRTLNLRSGDVIEIQGKGKAAAIVWPGFTQDTGRAVLRIDGTIRSNAQTGIDEKVTIRKVEAEKANKVVIQPTQPVRFGTGAEDYLSRMVIGRPFLEGNTFRINVLGNPLTFVIAKVSPKGIAIVTPQTEIEFRETPYEPKEGEKEISEIHYEDIGGLGKELEQVREMVELPLRHPEIFERLGIEPPKGVLLYGPPGTGKTLIARAVANEVDAHFITLSGPEIMSKYYGESEGKLREVFEEAQENAPTIIFIDEIDSIAPKREETKGEVERRVVAQLLSLMDGLKGRGQVIVIAATNIPDVIDPALRRGGRFDREIEIGIPDRKGRLEIFQVHTRGMPLDINNIKLTEEDRKELSDICAEKTEEELRKIKFLEPFANDTHGFVGADIALLIKEAAMHALRKILTDLKIEDEIPIELLDELKVTADDFVEALKHVEPSAMREVLVEIPDVSWEDVGGLKDVKQDLIEAVEWPLRYPEIYDKLNTRPPGGILLFGPPGTGKTLLAKAVANKSEKGVRNIFRKARQASPSIIFFDEIDALLPKRGSYEGSSHVTESVVSQILTELDGMEELTNVTILGATNRPDMLDEAVMRPGRLDRIIYVPPPDKESRKQIFEVYLSTSSGILADDISIDKLVEKTEGYVGADIESVVREAKLEAMREFIKTMGEKTRQERDESLLNVRVTARHFKKALSRVKGTLDRDSIEDYEERSWPVIFNYEECSVLKKALSTIKQADFGEKNDEKTAAQEALRTKTFAGVKDITEIKKLTEKLADILKTESFT